MNDMTNERVIQLIEAYGPEPAAWPEEERGAAETLLKRAPDLFADALEDARMLDAALASLPEPQAPAGLAERIITSAPFARAEETSSLLAKLKSIISIGGSVIPTASALASAAVGLMVGYGALGTVQTADVDTAEEALYAALDGGFDFYSGDFSQ